MTLDEAKKMVREAALKDGIECPCCEQWVKVYDRAMHAEMAHFLVLLYRHEKNRPGDYVKASTLNAGGDYAKLTAWGLVEQKPGKRKDGSGRTGYWRITRAGVDFVLCRTKLPSKARWEHSGRLVKLVDDKLIDIRDALGTRFSYDDLMAPALPA